MTRQTHHSGCLCCGSVCTPSDLIALNRREFLASTGLVTAGGVAWNAPLRAQNTQTSGIGSPSGRPLIVQPVLVYNLPTRHEGTSWRHWGGLHSESDVDRERARIREELSRLEANADFPLDILPLTWSTNQDEAAKVVAESSDVTLIYAAGGGVESLEALARPSKWNLVFLRHQSGPVYLWYEIISNRFLRKTVDDFGQPGITTRDVVVDRPEELLWRLRALAGLKNTIGKRVVCVGGAGGWGQGGKKAPRLTGERFSMELIDVPYEELAHRLQRAEEDQSLINRCRQEARRYLDDGGVKLATEQSFVQRTFLLREVFLKLLAEAETNCITVNQCMGTIMRVSGTTACLALSILNDEGYLAFCESDFVVIPSGILLHYISGKPVFLNDPTYPHDGIVTLAHCTAPRKMDSKSLEPVHLMTHFESDWGVAPKVEMTVGQEITVVDPDFNFNRWMGFKGKIVANPFMDICRSQIEVEFGCDTDRLNEETRGFHWMACYGDYTRETGYALRKVGMDWLSMA